jgi:hypothetical protein
MMGIWRANSNQRVTIRAQMDLRSLHKFTAADRNIFAADGCKFFQCTVQSNAILRKIIPNASDRHSDHFSRALS